MRLIVTGGAGFIGSAVVRHAIALGHTVVNVDKLGYSGNTESLAAVAGSPRYTLANLDICDRAGLRALVLDSQPDAVIHLAAETHVDRSIDDPQAFIDTNVSGTFNLLEAARELTASRGDDFRFLHVSTDEVYGALGAEGVFDETSPYQPNSPYAASKAASDHLVRAWHQTYGLPALITHCSNNYGPFQFPEKLIPLTIRNLLRGAPVRVYGDGQQVRDWLYVDDHVSAIERVLETGRPGGVYNIGADCEKTNIEIVETVIGEIEAQTEHDRSALQRLITHVEDRPGHDRRYAVDSRRVREELDWAPRTAFSDGIAETVAWYRANEAWCAMTDVVYDGQRLGQTGVAAGGN